MNIKAADLVLWNAFIIVKSIFDKREEYLVLFKGWKEGKGLCRVTLSYVYFAFITWYFLLKCIASEIFYQRNRENSRRKWNEKDGAKTVHDKNVVEPPIPKTKSQWEENRWNLILLQNHRKRVISYYLLVAYDNALWRSVIWKKSYFDNVTILRCSIKMNKFNPTQWYACTWEKIQNRHNSKFFSFEHLHSVACNSVEFRQWNARAVLDLNWFAMDEASVYVYSFKINGSFDVWDSLWKLLAFHIIQKILLRLFYNIISLINLRISVSCNLSDLKSW